MAALLSESGADGDQLETLVESLLWEGYALYPYTPSATKNATPTPFGIAYPPAYAQKLASTYDHLELRIVLRAPADAVLSAEGHLLRRSDRATRRRRSGYHAGGHGRRARPPGRGKRTTLRGEGPPLEVGLR